MDNRRKVEIEAIVDAALAGDAQGGIEGEPSLSSEFRRVGRAMRFGAYEAPAPAVSAAKAIMPQKEARPLIARLVYCSLQPQAVRAARAESFQMVFESDLGRLRLMYSPAQSGWEVLGQVEGTPPTISRLGSTGASRGKPVACDAEGRFSYMAASLAQTGVVLDSGGHRVWVPSATEAASGGRHEPS